MVFNFSINSNYYEYLKIMTVINYLFTLCYIIIITTKNVNKKKLNFDQVSKKLAADKKQFSANNLDCWISTKSKI